MKPFLLRELTVKYSESAEVRTSRAHYGPAPVMTLTTADAVYLIHHGTLHILEQGDSILWTTPCQELKL